MELHAFHWKTAVAQPHDYARAVGFTGLRADFQLRGQAFFRDDQRVIARRRHRLRRVLEKSLAVVLYLAGLAVHDLTGPHYVAAEGGADRLVPEANPQYRTLAREVLDQIDAD